MALSMPSIACSRSDDATASDERNDGDDDGDDDDDDDDAETVSEAIDPDEGGTVTSADGRLNLHIPPDALEEETTITVTRIDPDDDSVEFDGDGTFPVYRLEPEGLKFELPVAMGITIDRDDVPETVTDGDTLEIPLLGIESYGEEEGLEALSYGIGRETDGEIEIIAAISHFSDYVVREFGPLIVVLGCTKDCEVGREFRGAAGVGPVPLAPKVTGVRGGGAVDAALRMADGEELAPEGEQELSFLYSCTEAGAGSITVTTLTLNHPEESLGSEPGIREFAGSFFGPDELEGTARIEISCIATDTEPDVSSNESLAFDRIEPESGKPGNVIRLFVSGVTSGTLLDTASVWFEAEGGDGRLDATVFASHLTETEPGVPTTNARIDVIVPQVDSAAEWRVFVEFRDGAGEALVPETLSGNPLFRTDRSIVGRWNMNIAHEGAESCDDPNPSTDWYFWADGTWTDIGTTDALVGDESYAVKDGNWSLAGSQVRAESCTNDFGDTHLFEGTYDAATQTITGTYRVTRESGTPYVADLCSQSYSRPVAGCLDTICQPDHQPFGSCSRTPCTSEDGLMCLSNDGKPLCASPPEQLDQVIGCTLGNRCSYNSRCCDCRDDPEFEGEGIWICGGRLLNDEGCPGAPVEPGLSCDDEEVPQTCRYCSPDGEVTIQRCSAGIWEDR